jgi:hypothetical protein
MAFLFDPDDVLTFEKEKGWSPVQDSDPEDMKLPAKDARESGVLRTQKETMDVSNGVKTLFLMQSRINDQIPL